MVHVMQGWTVYPLISVRIHTCMYTHPQTPPPPTHTHVYTHTCTHRHIHACTHGHIGNTFCGYYNMQIGNKLISVRKLIFSISEEPLSCTIFFICFPFLF